MKYGLLGHEISYSLSPLIHTTLSSHINYELYDLSVEDLKQGRPEVLKELAGFNITIPHKQLIMAHCDSIHPLAEKIGAVNTVKISQGKWIGYNTDYSGFMRALKEGLPAYMDTKPVVVGYGGAARAILMALEELGFKQAVVCGGVSEADRREFIADMQTVLHMKLTDTQPKDKRLWINCTPVGSERIPEIYNGFMDLKMGDQLFDLNYKPYPTFLQQKARKLGIPDSNGIFMLIYQAVDAQKIWFDVDSIQFDMQDILQKCTNKGA